MSRWILLAAAALLLLPLMSCSSNLPVQPTPERIEDYFDVIVDEPSSLTEFIDACDFTIPAEIFVNQVYYSYDAVRSAIPKSLVTRGTDGSIKNGEIVEVYLSCDTDIAVFLIQTESADYQYGDFFGLMNLTPTEAQAIRDELLTFVPKRR